MSVCYCFVFKVPGYPSQFPASQPFNHVSPMGGFTGVTGFNQMPGVSTAMMSNYQPVTSASRPTLASAVPEPPKTGITIVYCTKMASRR